MPVSNDTAGVALQDRDFDILKGLFESRIMTTENVADLYFGGRREAAKKRLQRLRAAGVIRERPRRPYHPAILFLSSKGIRILDDRGFLKDYPRLTAKALAGRAQVGESTIRHELAVMAVKARLSAAINAHPGHEVAEFSTWPLLFQFWADRPAGDQGTGRSRELLIKPDGYIRVHDKHAEGVDEIYFFLEVDRSTESQWRLAMRAGCYMDYFLRGGLAVRYGQPRTASKDFPFRVLMVFPNAERRNNCAEKLLQATRPILHQVWLTTFPELQKDPLAAIWIRPLDYRKATAGTLFDPEKRRGLKIYQPRSEREQLVEEKIEKHRLFEA